MAVEVLVALALVVANGFFVATEFAVARLRPTQVTELELAGRPGARSVRHAVDHIDAYLAACQLGITLASIGLGVVGKPVFEELLEPVLGDAASVAGFGVAAALAFTIITLLHVVVGELAPKSLAIARAGPTALVVAPPMRLFYLLTKPVVDLFNAMGNLLLKPFGVPSASESGHAPHSEAELRSLLRSSHAGGLIDRQERDFAENAFVFADARLREVMRPRREIEFATTDMAVADAMVRALDSGHTRLPLCEPAGGLDATVGVVNLKDLVRASASGDDGLRDLARPLPRLSDATLLAEAMRELRRSRQHVALATDEYGTVVGLVSLEDLLEELVGEIEDEFDPEAPPNVTRDGETTMVSGGTPLRELERELALRVPDAHEATIGGYLIERLGRLPEVGERLELDGRRAEVTDVADGRIVALRLTSPAEGSSSA